MFVMTLCALRGFSTFKWNLVFTNSHYNLLKMFVLFSSIMCELNARRVKHFCIALKASCLLVRSQINTSDGALL